MPPTVPEAYEKNTKEQYEMLGRFVEAFELMIYEIREIILTISARDSGNIVLFQTALYHSALTAKPLFDILRAIIAEVLSDAIQQQEDRRNGIYDAAGPLWKENDGQPVEISLAERDFFSA
jgi:hypothetical protein